jgi:hypothetical protein
VGDAVETRIGLVVRGADVVLDPDVVALRRRLGEIDRGLHGFELAEEEPSLALGIVPVVEQGAGGGRDAGVAEVAPALDATADLVDELVRLDPLGADVEEVDLLLGRAGLLARCRNRAEELAAAPLVEHLVGDAVGVELEAARRRVVRRVEDRVLDRGARAGHPCSRVLLAATAQSASARCACARSIRAIAPSSDISA